MFFKEFKGSINPINRKKFEWIWDNKYYKVWYLREDLVLNNFFNFIMLQLD